MTSASAQTPAGARGNVPGEWRVWGADLWSSRYSPLDQITAENFNSLKLTWQWNAGAFGSDEYYRTTPLYANGRLFTVATTRYAPPGTAEDELAEALDRLLAQEWWPARYDGSALAQARRKKATSQLIGRFCLAAEGATMLRDLERTKQRYLADDLDIYFDDITDAAERIWDVLENYKEVAEALEDSNESVLSHRLNESLRVLTAFSVTRLPLTLISGVFGMNFDLPGDESLGEFWVVIVLMAIVLLGVVTFFRRRGYL